MEHVQFLDLTSTASPTFSPMGSPNADVRTLLVTSGHHSCAMSVWAHPIALGSLGVFEPLLRCESLPLPRGVVDRELSFRS